MTLTRKMLEALGLDDAKIDSVMEGHGETVSALKKQRDDALEASRNASDILAERDRLKQQVEELTKQASDAAKVRAEFDAYKQQVEGAKARTAKEQAVDALLKDAGVARESFRKTLRASLDLDSMELDEAGHIKDADTHKERIRTEYADFIGQTETGGTPRLDPPGDGTPVTYTREQIAAMKPDEIIKRWDAVSRSLPGIK